MTSRKIANIYDKLILGALILLVFLIPLAQTASTYAVNEPIKLMFFRIITVLIAAFWLVRIMESGEFSLIRTPLDLPLLAFLLIAVVATLFSIDPHLSTWGQLYRYEGLVTIISYIFIYYAAVHFVRRQGEQNLLLGSVLLVSGLVSVYAILQRFGIDFITWDAEMMDVTRSFATFGNPVFLGAYVVLVLPIAIIFAIFFRSVTRDAENSSDTIAASYGALALIRVLLRIASILLIPLLVAALIFSYTRAAWLGFLVAFIFIGLFSFSEVWKRKKIVAPVVAILVIVVVVFGFMVLRGNVEIERSVIERVRSIAKLSEGSVVSRLVLWNTSLQMIKGRPLLGFGLDTYALAFQQYQPANWYKTIKEEALPDKAHNEMLQIATSAGLLGLMVYLWLLVTFLVKGLGALRRARPPNRTLLVGLMAAIIGYLIQIQFSFSIISVAPLFWLLLGLTTAVMQKEEAKLTTFKFSEKSLPASFRVVSYAAVLILVAFLSISAVRPFLAEQHVRRAWTNQSFGFWDEAIRELEQAVKLDPGEGRYYIRLGEAYLMKYRTTHELSSQEKAFTALEVARRLSPRNENIYFYLGGLYVEMGKTSDPRYFDKAAINYKKVLELSPNDVDAHFDLGIAYANRNKYDLAIKEWRHVIVLDPKFVPAYLVLGRAYELRDEKENAKKIYQKALEIDANNAYAKRALEGLKGQ